MKRKIGKGLMAFGVLLVLGAAGDSDIGRLTLEGVILKLAIGISMFVLGYILHKNKGSKAEAKEHLFTDLSTDVGRVRGPAYKEILSQRKGFVNNETH